MGFEFLDAASQWLIGLVFLVLMLATSEAGFRLGCANKSTTSEVTESQISYLQAGIIGVLGLLLGFTLAMAVTRFAARKQLVVEESNAIGTSYLRAQLIPSPGGTEISNRLRDYVDVRLQYSFASTDPDDRQKAARARDVRLQGEFWSRAAAVAQKDPRSVPAGPLVQLLKHRHRPGFCAVGGIDEPRARDCNLCGRFCCLTFGGVGGISLRSRGPTPSILNRHPDRCHYSGTTCNRRPRPAG